MNLKYVVLDLTPAQARMINAALAMYGAEEHEEGEDFNSAVFDRTREKVWRAMERAGVEP